MLCDIIRYCRLERLGQMLERHDADAYMDDGELVVAFGPWEATITIEEENSDRELDGKIYTEPYSVWIDAGVYHECRSEQHVLYFLEKWRRDNRYREFLIREAGNQEQGETVDS